MSASTFAGIVKVSRWRDRPLGLASHHRPTPPTALDEINYAVMGPRGQYVPFVPGLVGCISALSSGHRPLNRKTPKNSYALDVLEDLIMILYPTLIFKSRHGTRRRTVYPRNQTVGLKLDDDNVMGYCHRPVEKVKLLRWNECRQRRPFRSTNRRLALAARAGN